MVRILSVRVSFFVIIGLCVLVCSPAHAISIKEDAEDGDTVGWAVNDNTPAGATISNVYDGDKDSRVIGLWGPGGYFNCFRFTWGYDPDNTLGSWSMKYIGGGDDDKYVFYIYGRLDTGEGVYLSYSTFKSISDSKQVASGNYYIYHKLPESTKDGNWHTITRDFAADVRDAANSGNPVFDGFENREIDFLYRIFVRGNIYIDDIILNRPPEPKPKLIRFMGNLKDADGLPLEGAYNVTLRLYEHETDETAVWEEVQQVDVATGLLDVELGSVTPLDILFDRQYWLGIEVEADGEMSPRFRLTSVPYAFSNVE